MIKIKYPKVSIIIPLYVIEDRFFKDLKKFDKLNYPNYEIIIVCDKEVNIDNPSIRFIKTGKKRTGPAEKRDIAIKASKGEICAFIDDDAYPNIDWINNAVKWFKNDNVVAVGGPGVTPKEDNFWQKVGGGIIESFFCSGGVQYRYVPTQKAFVFDYPAYNLFVRTKILRKVGGYDCNFYGGEDTFLCLKLIKYGDIIYDPNVVVNHHRRAFPLQHLKQIGNVGIHRGYFFKKFPETSRVLFYLLPTLMTIGLFSCILLSVLYTSIFLPITLLVFVFFWLLGAWSVLRRGYPLRIAIISGIGIIVTHINYGINFIIGTLTPYLNR